MTSFNLNYFWKADVVCLISDVVRSSTLNLWGGNTVQPKPRFIHLYTWAGLKISTLQRPKIKTKLSGSPPPPSVIMKAFTRKYDNKIVCEFDLMFLLWAACVIYSSPKISKLSSRFLAQLLLHGVLEDKVTGFYMTYDLMFPADPQEVPLMHSLHYVARLFWVED